MAAAQIKFHPFLLLLFIPGYFCGDFEITDFSPKDDTITVKEGDSLVLSCTGNKYIRGCTWRHKDKSCKLDYSYTANKLVKSWCLVYEDKINPMGNYENHECSIKLHPVDLYDDGAWKCEVREYVTRWNIFQKPEEKFRLFSVKVTPSGRKAGEEE